MPSFNFTENLSELPEKVFYKVLVFWPPNSSQFIQCKWTFAQEVMWWAQLFLKPHKMGHHWKDKPRMSKSHLLSARGKLCCTLCWSCCPKKQSSHTLKFEKLQIVLFRQHATTILPQTLWLHSILLGGSQPHYRWLARWWTVKVSERFAIIHSLIVHAATSVESMQSAVLKEIRELVK